MKSFPGLVFFKVRIFNSPVKYFPVSEFRILFHFFRSSLCDYFTAKSSGPGPHVNDVICLTNGILIMLNDNNGISQSL